GYARAIAAFFLSERFSVRRPELERRLAQQIEGFSELAPETQAERLCCLLGAGELPFDLQGRENDTSYQSQIKVFSGDLTGWKQYTDLFWRMVQEAEPTDITFCDFGDVDWNTTEHIRFEKMIGHVIRAVRQGHRVCIIDILSDSYRSYDVLGRWLDMYMTDGVDIHYIIGNFTDAEKGSYACLRDKAASVGYYFENRPDLLTYTFYTDQRMRNYYQARVEDYRARSKPIFKRLSLGRHTDIVDLMAEHLSTFDPTYMICPEPTYIAMPQPLLNRILRRNGVGEEEIDRCLQTVHKRHEIRHHCKYIQIYDSDAIERRLQEERSEVTTLSRVFGRPIWMTREQTVEQLKYVQQVVERGEMEVVLAPFEKIGLDESGVSMIVQNGKLAVIWHDGRYDNLLYSTEPTYIGGYYSYLQSTYEAIPPMYKNMAWVRQRLQEYIGNG
ncbi:MAG: hypothetical protein AB7C89_05905, partial [Intestinibacillus sp.]